MSATALLVDLGSTTGAGVIDDGSDVDEPGLGVVSVHLVGLANTAAGCSCGWAGGRRLLKAAAVQDAWAHAIRHGCAVSSPLVIDW